MTEKMMTKYRFDNRFHVYFDDRFSLLQLSDAFDYQYELWDMKESRVIGRYASIIKAIDAVKYQLKKHKGVPGEREAGR